MRLLYLKGSEPNLDASTIRQLTELGDGVEVTPVESLDEILAEVKREGTAFRALLVSPALSEKETLELIVSLRKERVQTAIVPVVREAQRGLCTSAVAAGADAVLLMLHGDLVEPKEILSRISSRTPTEQTSSRWAPSAVAATQRALSELRKLTRLTKKTSAQETTEEPAPEPEPVTEDPSRVLEARLKEAQTAGARMEASPVSAKKPGTSEPSPAERLTSSRRPVGPPRPTGRQSRWNDKVLDGTVRAALEGSLNAARLELRKALDAHTADRRTWESTQEQLNAEIEANRTDPQVRADLRAALEQAQTKFEEAAEATSLERAAWYATRRDLEGRIGQLEVIATEKVELEEALAAERAAKAEVETSLAAERAAKADVEAALQAERATEAELESALNTERAAEAELESSLTAERTAKSELEAQFSANQAEMQRLSDGFESERSSWQIAEPDRAPRNDSRGQQRIAGGARFRPRGSGPHRSRACETRSRLGRHTTRARSGCRRTRRRVADRRRAAARTGGRARKHAGGVEAAGRVGGIPSQ
jgi:hypothetical protein